MANTKPCKVRTLPGDIREQVDTMLAKGIPCPAISKWLATQGHQVTVRQLYNYKDKCLHPVSPVQPVSNPIYSEGANDHQMLEGVIKVTLDALAMLRDDYNMTRDSRTGRLLKEMSETAGGLLKFRISNGGTPDPVLNISLNVDVIPKPAGMRDEDWDSDLA